MLSSKANKRRSCTPIQFKEFHDTVLNRVKDDHCVRDTTPHENKRRRAVCVGRKNGAFGFTIQTYGIKRDPTGPMDPFPDKAQETVLPNPQPLLPTVHMITFIDYVAFESPAFYAGLKRGDVILAVNGISMETTSHEELVTYIASQHSIRVVVLFEDCSRKIDLNLRYLKLKEILQAKIKELAILELQQSILTSSSETTDEVLVSLDIIGSTSTTNLDLLSLSRFSIVNRFGDKHDNNILGSTLHSGSTSTIPSIFGNTLSKILRVNRKRLSSIMLLPRLSRNLSTISIQHPRPSDPTSSSLNKVYKKNSSSTSLSTLDINSKWNVIPVPREGDTASLGSDQTLPYYLTLPDPLPNTPSAFVPQITPQLISSTAQTVEVPLRANETITGVANSNSDVNIPKTLNFWVPKFFPPPHSPHPHRPSTAGSKSFDTEFNFLAGQKGPIPFPGPLEKSTSRSTPELRSYTVGVGFPSGAKNSFELSLVVPQYHSREGICGTKRTFTNHRMTDVLARHDDLGGKRLCDIFEGDYWEEEYDARHRCDPMESGDTLTFPGSFRSSTPVPGEGERSNNELSCHLFLSRPGISDITKWSRSPLPHLPRDFLSPGYPPEDATFPLARDHPPHSGRITHL